MDVSILIVTYNSVAHISECLRSIPEACDGVMSEVVVIDNASQDGTPDVVAAEFPSVTLLREPVNHGFAKAHNIAARRSIGRYILLLNPDGALHRNAVANLVAFADEQPAHGVYGGATYSRGGSIDPKSGWDLPTPWSMFCFAVGLTVLFPHVRLCNPTSIASWARTAPRQVGAVSGCLLLCRRDVWLNLGGLDERYFLYGEDIDFGYRARAAGYDPVVIPGACMTHLVGGSSPDSVRRTQYVLAGRARFINQRWGPGWRAVGLLLLQLGVAVRAVAELVGNRSGPGRWRSLWGVRHQWVCGHATVASAKSQSCG